MSRAKQILEMAMPDSYERGRVYYHGTSSWKAAQKILYSGIKPSMIDDDDYSPGHYSLTPVRGRVYLTPQLSYALIYALGGDVAGSQSMKNVQPGDFDEQFGAVFSVSGQKLADIQPDEDSIGQLIYKKQVRWLNDLADDWLDARLLRDVMRGEYDAWATAGRELVDHLSDKQKHELLHLPGVHYANEGMIKPDHCWKVDKVDTWKYKPDGSNFFQLAKKVK